MDNVSIIAAIGKYNEIGRGNNLIWHFKDDMKFFRKNTMGKPVVMGRNTYLSLPKKLEGRENIILTTRAIEVDSDVLIMRSLKQLLEYIRDYKDEVMIIGGEAVYREMISYANKLLLTEIDSECVDATAYFPRFNKDLYDVSLVGGGEEDGISFKHKVYTKK